MPTVSEVTKRHPEWIGWSDEKGSCLSSFRPRHYDNELGRKDGTPKSCGLKPRLSKRDLLWGLENSVIRSRGSISSEGIYSLKSVSEETPCLPGRGMETLLAPGK